MRPGLSLPFRKKDRSSSDSGSDKDPNRYRRRRQFASALGALRRKAFPQSSNLAYQSIENVGASENYGMTDFRSIGSWRFLSRPFLKTEEKAKISIGVLHVKAVEARGLLAANMRGKSDPYLKLILTGRYLSNGQEWSESLRIKETTRYIRNTLDPVWNEEFSLPVRRAGAVLKVEVWDKDFASADDELGDFEIHIGEELLSQKPTDMWYVVEAPRGMELAAAAVARAKRYQNPGPMGQEAPATETADAASPAEVHEQAGDGDKGKEDDRESAKTQEEGEWEAVDVGIKGTADDPDRDSFPSTRSTAEGRLENYAGMFKPPTRSTALLDRYSHANTPHERRQESADEARYCEEDMKRRRTTVGEVRLQLRFEFDNFAETCSHLWPEEPELPPSGPPFSPNRLYYKAMLLMELARPYLGFMLEANAVVTWLRPWRSLFWLVFLSVMLIFPSIFIVVFNVVLMLVTIAGYLNQNYGEVGEGEAANSSAGHLEEGMMQSGLRRANSTPSATVEPINRSMKTPSIKLRPDILDPEYAAGDAEMGEVYKKVASAKKLPIVVEEAGKRFFSVNGSVMQRQVDLMSLTLLKMRRRFRPLEGGGLLRMMLYLTLNMILQLWLYLSGRFNLYLLLLCMGVFSYYFYYRRGKAFIMAIQEASRTRKAKLAYTADNLSSGSIPPSRSTLGQTHWGIIHKRYPAFAPSGATPVADTSIPSMTRSLIGGASTMATSSSSRGVTGLFRKSLIPRGDWFTPAHRRRASDAMARGSPQVEEVVPASSFVTTGESNVVLLRPTTEMEAGNDITLFDLGHDQAGSVQQPHPSRVLRMPKWASPWRRVVGKGDSEDTALVGSAEGGRAWVPKLSTWSPE